MKALPAPTRHQGFTLAEVATVMVIVALVLGGIMMGLPTQIENARTSEAHSLSDNVRSALLGYAIQNQFLPCPDITGNGLEGRAPAGNCTSNEGWLPFATLGLSRTDPWGNRVRYRVDPVYADSAAPITLATPTATLDVCTTATCTAILADNVPAVWVMHGDNGLRARGNAFNLHSAVEPIGADEAANADGRNANDTITNPCAPTTLAPCRFVMHAPQEATAVGGKFDDVVNWLPPGILINRLIEAGTLP